MPPNLWVSILPVVAVVVVNLVLLAYGYGKLNSEVHQAKQAANDCLESHKRLSESMVSVLQTLARLDERGTHIISQVDRIEEELRGERR